MTADRITDALDLLARAVETHGGAPADTNIARAQVLATIAVAEQLAKLTQAVAAQHGPPAPATHTTGGQAETAPEQPDAPRLMLGDVWEDRDGDSWRVVANAAGELRLTLSGHPCTWGGVDGAYGLTLVERAGYRRTAHTVPVWQLRTRTVISCPAWEDDAPVTITGSRYPASGGHAPVEVEYRELGGDRTTVVAVTPYRPLGGDRTTASGPDMRVTLWDEIAGGAR